MIIKYLIILVTTFMPVTLSFEIKIRSMSRYVSVSDIINYVVYLLEIVQITNKLEGWRKLQSCLYVLIKEIDKMAN